MSATTQSASSPETSTCRNVEISKTPPALSRSQGEAWLTRREWEVLAYLSGHAGRFVPSEELVDALWFGAADASVPRNHVASLRRKLGAAFIEWAHGLGYRVSQQRSDALLRECGRCRRPIVDYGQEWICYACGATGEGPQPIESHDLDVGRAPYREGSRSGKGWTADERAFVMEHLEDMTLDAIGRALNRSESAVRGFMDSQGLRKRYVRSAPR